MVSSIHAWGGGEWGSRLQIHTHLSRRTYSLRLNSMLIKHDFMAFFIRFRSMWLSLRMRRACLKHKNSRDEHVVISRWNDSLEESNHRKLHLVFHKQPANVSPWQITSIGINHALHCNVRRFVSQTISLWAGYNPSSQRTTWYQKISLAWHSAFWN